MAHSHFPETSGPVLSSSNSSVERDWRVHLPDKVKCVTCQMPCVFYIMEAGLDPAVSHLISSILLHSESNDGQTVQGGDRVPK